MTFTVRQSWMAQSEKVSGWPRLPFFLAYQSMFGSNQTDNEPRQRSDAL